MPIMPRKAITIDPKVPQAIERIDCFCKERNTCVLRLANDVGVSQSSLYRFITHERKTITRTAEKVLKHIDNWHNSHKAHSQAIMSSSGADQAGRELIESAIMSLWDGNFHSAQILAPLIRALKPTVEIAVTMTSG